MRIIHCADIHLDSALTAHMDRRMARGRRNEILNTFRRMLAYADKHEVDAVIIAGDLFDTETVSVHTVGTLLSELGRYPHTEVFLLWGNHDRGRDVFGGCELPGNLHMFGDEWTYYELGGVVIAGVCLDKDNCERIYDELELDEDKVNIVTLHGQIREKSSTAGEDIILTDRLCGKGIDYLALGHIHKYTQDRLDSRGVYCYPGCLEGRGFDECGDKGFVLLDTDGSSVYTEFVPFAERRLMEVEVRVTGACDSSGVSDRVYEKLRRTGVREKDMVRILLTGELDVESTIDTDYVTKQLEESYYYVRIKDKTTLRVDYMRYAHDESLKGEFIRTVMSQDMSDEDKAFVIQTGIRALGGEEIWIR